MDLEKILSLGVDKKIINEEQKEKLIDLYKFQQVGESKPVSSVVKVLYYIVGLVMFIAMVVLMSDTIQNGTYMTILLLGTVYAALFIGIGEFLWRKNEKFPAEILYFIFISTIAFIIMDIEKMTGFFPHFSDMNRYANYLDMCRLPVIVLSTLTIVTNSILQAYRPISLLAIPTIFCSYVIFMSFVEYVYGCANITDEIIFNSIIIFGIGLTIVAFIKDKLTKVDYSKWMYFFGALGIFISIMLQLEKFDLDDWQCQLICFILSLVYFFIGFLIRRKPFSIIGLLGLIEYIIYLECSNIKSTTFLTSTIIITGLTLLYAGVVCNKNINKLERFIEGLLPKAIKNYLPQNRV